MNTVALEKIELTIVECCKRLTDAIETGTEANEVETTELLKKMGDVLEKRGGLAEMQRVVNALHQEYARKETEAGNAYRVGPICNDAWDGIGMWIR